MKAAHLSLRLPAELARALAGRAAARGLPKSAVVREAVQHYLAPGASEPRGGPVLTARQLAARWSGLPRLERAEADGLAEDVKSLRAMLPVPTPPWE